MFFKNRLTRERVVYLARVETINRFALKKKNKDTLQGNICYERIYTLL